MEYMTLLNNNNVHDKFRDKKKKKMILIDFSFP